MLTACNAPFYRLTAGEKEYKLKLTTATKIEVEDRIGCSLLEALDKLAYTKVFALTLWGALQKYQANMTLPKTYELIDALEAEGFTLEDRADTFLGIMKVSGFFTPEQIADMEREDEEQEIE